MQHSLHDKETPVSGWQLLPNILFLNIKNCILFKKSFKLISICLLLEKLLSNGFVLVL